MLIIGITGTLGAGKGTIVRYLTRDLDFAHYSVRAFVSEEIRSRGLPVNRDTMVEVANDLRAKHSPSYIIDQLYEQASEEGRNAIIESIRTPGEVESLRKKGNFHLFAVDAIPLLRYERIQVRESETDHVTFETFLENEQREYSSDDPNKQNLKKCIEMADHFFENNGTIEHLCLQVQEVLDIIMEQ
ncbi:MAG TPA: AAA family ATPase [Bacteroidales bacterium]|nr:AAA family ATPase [Bacteroidales bacterium]HNS46083.1 AAA family ATPase [Bacteroidales bacterium]